MKMFQNKWIFALLLMVVTAGLVACSSDDDEGTTLETPQYEAVSARYDVTSTDSDIKSIELTASGNYIIVKNGNSYRAPKKAAASKKARFIARSVAVVTRASGIENIISGKFTQISDTEFLLEGYGKIVIEGSSDNALSITVTPDGGSAYTVPVAKHTQNPSSTLTSQICRTWNFASTRFAITLGGKKIFDKEYGMNELSKLVADLRNLSKQYSFDDDDDDDEWDDDDYFDYDDDELPTQVIFTKSGTYMVIYKNGTLAVSTWTWENESTGLLRYSWDYEHMYEEWASGNVNVGFRGNQLAITESESEDYDEEDGTPASDFAITYYMNEVK